MYPSISLDGRYVAFASSATNLVPGDTSYGDVYDRQTDTIEKVSVATDGTAANNGSSTPAISGDGRYVAFESMSPDLAPGDTGYDMDIFVRDRQAGTTELVSVDNNENEVTGWSYAPSITADGRYVAFCSTASTLVPGDTNGVYDIFVRDRVTHTTYRLSLDTAGGDPNSYSYYPAIAAYGPYPVAFESAASDLVAGDTNGKRDIFLVFTSPLAVRWPR